MASDGYEDYLKDFHQELNSALDNALIYLSGGAFLVSLTLLDVLGTKQGKCWLVIAWVALFLSVTFNLLSRALALAYSRKIHDSDDGINNKDTWRSWISFVHYLSLVFLTTGLFLLLVFGVVNL